MTEKIDLAAIRARLAAATPGPWHTVDVRCDDAKPNEVGVCALTDPRSFQKPDGTWHGCFVARGMDGPTRDANATLIAEAPAYLAALCDEVERLRESSARLRTAVEHGESVYHEIARAAGFDHEPPSDERACIAAVKALRAERDALRAIIAGRTTPPTGAMTHDRCSFCARADVPLVRAKTASTCLDCARLAVEALSPAGERGYFVACGCDETGRCTWNSEDSESGDCDCLCHGGEGRS